jgi:hypothetical protein
MPEAIIRIPRITDTILKLVLNGFSSSQLNHMGLDIWIMISQGLNTVRVKALLPNPGQRLLLQRFIRCDVGSDHLLPALAGIASAGEQQHKSAFCIPHLYGKQAVVMARNVDQLDGAVAQQIILSP